MLWVTNRNHANGVDPSRDAEKLFHLVLMRFMNRSQHAPETLGPCCQE